MKAVVYDGELRLVGDYPRPVPTDGEALVRVRLAGICNTDLEITRGYAGFRGVLGHEFLGIVEQAPTDTFIGRRVVGEINCTCGVCPYCRGGLSSHCTRRTVLGIAGRDGAMAELVTLPERNLHIVPDTVSDVRAVFTEPLAAALQVLEQMHIRSTQRAIVLGDGKLGLLVAQVLALTGCELLAVGRHSEKLAILNDRGISTVLERDLTGERADVVVECTGRADGLTLARQLVRPRGTIVVKSTYAGHMEFAFSPLVVDEVSIVGSRCGPFEPALRLLERGVIEVESLVSAVYGLDEAEQAFHRARTAGTLKVLVRTS